MLLSRGTSPQRAGVERCVPTPFSFRAEAPFRPPSEIALPLDLPSHEAAPEAVDAAVDFAFLASQTFGDEALQRDVLGLFVTQANRAVAAFARMDAGEQDVTAHRLKGSCQGIGAWAAADAAQAFYDAPPLGRLQAFRRLTDALAAAREAIRARLRGIEVAEGGPGSCDPTASPPPLLLPGSDR